MILDDIIAKKKVYLKNVKELVSDEEIRLRCEGLNRTPISLARALKRSELSIIAEIKKASPSRGLIRPSFDPEELAREYSESDVQAISVLTETDYFQGGPQCLQAARQASQLPLLRKDFIIDEYQIYEAYVLGADAILLIVAALNDAELSRFRSAAEGLGLSCLTEVHNEEELSRVLNLDFQIIGINNRNLHTFEENLNTTAKLIQKIPSGKVIVSESGMKTAEDVALVRSFGADAVLIGEMFMRQENVKIAIQNLRDKL